MQLNAQMRDLSVKLEDVRFDGLVPAVFYGTKQASTNITINHGEFLKLYKESGETTIIDLMVDGKAVPVLIHKVQINPVNHKLLHVDFLAIDKNTKLTVSIPLEYVGTAPAVDNGLGVLNTVMDELEIEVLPNELPQELMVDISKLEKVGDSIRVADITLPKSAKATMDDEATVCTISDFQKEEEESPADATIDFDATEVEKKGKKEEEAE